MTNRLETRISQGIVDDSRFSLLRSYPNPFNNVTVLAYVLPERADVTVAIFDIRGVCIRSLLRTMQDPGIHTLDWDGTNDEARSVASGTYFARMQYGGLVRSTRLVLIK